MENKNNTPVEIDEVKLQETIARVIKGEGSEEDIKFVKDIEELIGEPVIGEKSRMLAEKIKANKNALAQIVVEKDIKLEKLEKETAAKLAENDADYERKLKDLNVLQFDTEQKARARQTKMRLIWGIVALCAVTFVTKIFGIGIGLFVLGIFAVIFYAFKNR